MDKVWRLDGIVTCGISVWIQDCESEEEAIARIMAAPDDDLFKITSIGNIHPIKETMNITNSRESTEDNP